MFPVSVPTPFRSLWIDLLRGTLPRPLIEITPCPLLNRETAAHCRGTTTSHASCTVCSISRAFQGPSSSATDKRGIGFYVAQILDPVNFKGSYGSCEKDDNREAAVAAVAAAGRLVSSSSAALINLDLS